MLEYILHRPRLVLLLAGSFCFVAVASAALLGQIFALEVCAMCWFQRLSFLLAGAGFLLAAAWPWARVVTQRIGELGLLLGLESAGRQSYLLSHLDAAKDNCGAGLFYYFQIEDYEGFFRAGMLGGIDCAENQPLIFGLQLPQWSLLAFILITALYIAWLISQRSASRKVSA